MPCTADIDEILPMLRSPSAISAGILTSSPGIKSCACSFCGGVNHLFLIPGSADFLVIHCDISLAYHLSLIL